MIYRFLLVFLIVCVFSGRIESQETFPDSAVVSSVIEKLSIYERLLAAEASVHIRQLTCVSHCDVLSKLLSQCMGRPASSEYASLRSGFDSLVAPSMIVPPVYFIEHDVEFASDGRRTRNGNATLRSDGVRVETTNIKDGEYQFAYTKAEEGQSGNVVVTSTGQGVKPLVVKDFLPVDIVAFLRTARGSGRLSVERMDNNTRITFELPAFTLSGFVDYDTNTQVALKTHIDFGRNVEERHYRSYERRGEFDIPQHVLSVVATRSEGREFTSAFVQLMDIQGFVGNPPLGDEVFKLAVPARTTIQHFNGQNEVERVHSNRPVEDLARHVGELDGLAITSVASPPHYRWGFFLSVLIGGCLLICVVIVFAWRRRSISNY